MGIKENKHMEDFDIVIKQSDGTEIVTNIEEDIIRMAIGLERKE